VNNQEPTSLFANSQGQILSSHGAGVAKRAVEIFDSLVGTCEIPVEKEIRLRTRLRCFVFWAGIFHDVGKADKSFQTFIKSKIQQQSQSEASDGPDAQAYQKKDGTIPFHNEISWAVIKTLQNCYFKKSDDLETPPTGLIPELLLQETGSNKPLQRRSKKFEDLILPAVYWHHKLNASDKDPKSPRFPTLRSLHNALSDAYPEEGLIALMKSAQQVINGSLSRLGLTLESVLLSTEQIEDKIAHFIDQGVGTPLFSPTAEQGWKPNSEDWLRLRANSWQQKLVLHILVEADRQISSISAQHLENFLDKKWSFETEQNHNSPKALHSNIDHRSKEQFEIASLLSQSALGVCAADPGSGKTTIALLAHFISSSKKPSKLYIALPQQQQIEGLFRTIQKDLKRLDFEGLSIEGVYAGVRQHTTDNVSDGILNSEINLLTLDRLFSPSYSWRHDELITILKSNIVLDEFHAVSYISNMLPVFFDLVAMKRFCRGGGFLLCLSGTPNPALLKLAQLPQAEASSSQSEVYVPRTRLSPVHNEPSHFHVVHPSDDNESGCQNLITKTDIEDDSLVAHLKRKDAQQHFINLAESSKSVSLIHSLFIPQHRKEKIEFILDKYGKPGAADGIVVSAKLLNASFDLNFKHLHNVLHSADYDCQILARKNRHGGKANGNVFLYQTSKKSKGDRGFFNDESFGFLGHHAAWNDHVSNVIGKSSKALSHREAMLKLYDEFWTVECTNAFSSELFTSALEAQTYLSDNWFPVRSKNSADSGRKNTQKSGGNNPGFRGSSLLCTAVEVNEKRQTVNQLIEGDLLPESLEYYVKRLKITTRKLAMKSTKGSFLNLNGVFDFTKHSASFDVDGFSLGRSERKPLIWSHVTETSSGKTEIENREFTPRYYHHALGLVESDLLDNFLKIIVKMSLEQCLKSYSGKHRPNAPPVNLLG
jgi:hypothetical protein